MNELITMLLDNTFILIMVWVIFSVLTLWNSVVVYVVGGYFLTADRERFLLKLVGSDIRWRRRIEQGGIENVDVFGSGSYRARLIALFIVWMVLGVFLFE